MRKKSCQKQLGKNAAVVDCPFVHSNMSRCSVAYNGPRKQSIHTYYNAELSSNNIFFFYVYSIVKICVFQRVRSFPNPPEQKEQKQREKLLQLKNETFEKCRFFCEVYIIIQLAKICL